MHVVSGCCCCGAFTLPKRSPFWWEYFCVVPLRRDGGSHCAAFVPDDEWGTGGSVLASSVVPAQPTHFMSNKTLFNCLPGHMQARSPFS